MLWRYTRREVKVLLITTLCVGAGFAFSMAGTWRTGIRDTEFTANTVGVVAGVERNGVNTRMAQLDERARVLDEREAKLVSVEYGTQRGRWVEVGIGTVLLGLILLNFYLDHRHRVHSV